MLTVLVPIFGREEFTPRLRKNAGGWLRTFDASFDMLEFHKRMLREIEAIETPYTMIGDNDDLIIKQACDQCIEFLELEPDYVAAYGRIGGFEIRGNKPYGPTTRLERDYTPFGKPETFDQDIASHRVLRGFANESLYYAIHRTEVLMSIWEDVVGLKLEDYQAVSKFCSMAVLKRGKVKAFNDTYYLRQYGTYINFPHRFSFPGRLMTNKFSYERDAILDNVCEGDKVFRAVLVISWAKWWEDYFRRNYGTVRKIIKHRYPRVAECLRYLMPMLSTLAILKPRLRFYANTWWRTRT